MIGKIELGYISFCRRTNFDPNGQSKEHFESKQTWLAASHYIWREVLMSLNLESDDERTARLKEIRSELNKPHCAILSEFQRTCFPTTPIGILHLTWFQAGSAMFEIAFHVACLPPGAERKAAGQPVFEELERLKTTWYSNPS